MKELENAKELKTVIRTLVEKIDAGKYRAFSLQLETVANVYKTEFSDMGIRFNVLIDLYYLEDHDENIKTLLTRISNVLDSRIKYLTDIERLSEEIRAVEKSEGFIDKYRLSMALCYDPEAEDALY